ncbi:MAG TPA: hypothetical protein VJB99_01760 [Patescibacteria group bacterium]|nr:hypothetical protein [Patescibacteria group bacterium]
MGVWALLLLMLFVGLGIDAGDEEILFFLIPLPVLLLVSLPLFLDFAAKHLLFFSGRGKPEAEQKIKQTLLGLGGSGSESVLTVVERKKGLSLQWNFQNETWKSLLFQHRVHSLYALRIRFDERSHTATFVEQQRSISWSAGLGKGGMQFKFSGFWFRGISYTKISFWSMDPLSLFRARKPESFSFSSEELKVPMIVFLLQNGWNVRFGLW